MLSLMQQNGLVPLPGEDNKWNADTFKRSAFFSRQFLLVLLRPTSTSVGCCCHTAVVWWRERRGRQREKHYGDTLLLTHHTGVLLTPLLSY